MNHLPSEADVAAAHRIAPHTDLVGMIMAFEDGSLSPDDTILMFSRLIQTGQVWTMQGSYGRAAANLIENGSIDPTGLIL